MRRSQIFEKTRRTSFDLMLMLVLLESRFPISFGNSYQFSFMIFKLSETCILEYIP